MVRLSLNESRAGVNRVLTNLAQTEFIQPEMVGRLLFPLVEVSQRGGLIIEFDSIGFKQVDDNRAPGAPFPTIQDGYGSSPYSVKNKGLRYILPEEHEQEAAQIGFDWGERAQQSLMAAEALNLEIEQMTVASDAARYATGHAIALTPANRFNNPEVNPGSILREGKSLVRGKIGRNPNVLLLGSSTFDAIVENPQVVDRTKHTGRDSITTEMIAALYGFDRVEVAQAIKENPNGTPSYVFPADGMVMAYTNPQALANRAPANTQDNLGANFESLRGGYRVPYQTTGRITRYQPSYGYTYVYQGHPTISNRLFDQLTDSHYYKIKFDRDVAHTGVRRADKKVISGVLYSTVVGAIA